MNGFVALSLDVLEYLDSDKTLGTAAIQRENIHARVFYLRLVDVAQKSQALVYIGCQSLVFFLLQRISLFSVIKIRFLALY